MNSFRKLKLKQSAFVFKVQFRIKNGRSYQLCIIGGISDVDPDPDPVGSGCIVRGSECGSRGIK